MRKIKLKDGREYGLNGLKTYVVEPAVDDLVEPLSRGLAPDHLPLTAEVEKARPRHGRCAEVLSAMQGLTLNDEEMAWYETLAKYRDKLASFDRKRYEALEGERREAYAVGFGRACVALLHILGTGAEPPPDAEPLVADVKGYWEFLTGQASVMVRGKDGTKRPMGLDGESGGKGEKPGRKPAGKASRRRLVLVLVCDDRHLLESLAEVLEMHDFECHQAGTAQAGIDMASRVRPDAVITDLGLPDSSGAQVCATLRKRFKRMPLVIMTGAFVTPEQKKAMLARGADEVIIKPFDLDKFIPLIRRLCR